MLKESFEMSIQNILSNKLRSFLTTLGIIIGVTAIIALITIVEGATGEITSQFNQLGAGKITIQAQGTPLKRGLLESDMEKLAQIEHVAGVSPNVSLTLDIAGSGNVIEDVSVEGRNAVYFTQDSAKIAKGRALTPLDMETTSRVCVVNEALVQEVFFDKEALGETVVIGGHSYTIVGILDAESADDVMSAMTRMMGSSGDAKVIIPYKSALRMTGGRNITSLEIFVGDTTYTDDIIDEAEAILAQAFNYKDNAYSIINLESLLDTMNTMLDMMKTMLAGIASIALLVGGIGIMNMMLVSVTERTSEIGLRKALGAQPKRIQIQFLLESVVLSIAGGIVGIVLGNLLSAIAASLIGYTFIMSPGAVSLGFFFSLLVGVLFGWAPARKASQLNPIDALRTM